MVLEEVIERTLPPGDSRAGPGQLEAPQPLPYPWNVNSTYLLHARSFPQGTTLR